MYKILSLLPVLLLNACYYDSKTGCVQHFNYRECPVIDIRTLEKDGDDGSQKYLDHKDCIAKTKTRESRYQCMIDKGYKRITPQ